MSQRPPPPQIKPPSPPLLRSRKRCLNQRDEAEPPQPPPNLRRAAPASQSSSSDKSYDSDARTLPPHKRNPECGLAVAKKNVPNGVSLGTRFQGGIAHGLGAAVDVDEGYYGDSEEVDGNGDGRYHNLSGEESKSLPRTTRQIVPRVRSHSPNEQQLMYASYIMNSWLTGWVDNLFKGWLNGRTMEEVRAENEIQKEKWKKEELQSKQKIRDSRRDILTSLMKKKELDPVEVDLRDMLMAEFPDFSLY